MLNDLSGGTPCPSTSGYYRVTQGQSRVSYESLKKMYATVLVAPAIQKPIRLQYNLDSKKFALLKVYG